jgi:hypothetical protein
MSNEVAEVAVERLHQIMLEVKEYLEDTVSTPKGQKLLGKVEHELDNWDDDAFFGDQADEDLDDEEDEGDEDEDLDDEDEDLDDDLDDEEDDEFVDHEDEDEGSILDAQDEEDDD